MNQVIASAALLAAEEKNITANDLQAGLIGAFFFVAFFVAIYFLWRSMNKQLKRVDAHFEAADPTEAPVRRSRDTLSVQDLIAEAQAAQLARKPGEPGEPPTGTPKA